MNKTFTFFLILFTPLYSSTFAQLNESFDGTFPPLGWTTFVGSNGAGPNQDWQKTTSLLDINTGTGAAFVRYEVTGGPLAEDWLVTPKLRPTAGNFTLSFYQKQTYVTDYGTVYSIRVSTTDQNNPASYTTVASQTETNFTTNYTLASVDLSAYIGQDIYVAFVMSQDDGDNWYIDDVTGPDLAPQCLPPSNIALSNITLTTADITWNQNNATNSWEIETIEANTPPTGAGQFVNFNPATYPTLNPATTYNVYMRDVCGAGDTSIWVGPVQFATLCPTVFTAPFVEDFDLPFTQNCWTEGGANAWDYSTNATYAAATAGDHSGNNTNYAWMDGSFNNNGAVSTLTSPPIDISSLTIPEVSFWVYSSNNLNNTYNTLAVEVWNGSTWTNIYQNQGDLGGWQEVKYYLNAVAPTGPIQVRFTITGSFDPSPWYNDILIDDFVVQESPDCPTPSNLTTASVGNTTADLSWLSNGTGTSWEVEVIEAGNPVTGSGTVVNSNPYTVTGLQMGTPYSFYVREICSPGDTSTWAGPFNFITGCGVFTAPYLETFDKRFTPGCWTESGANPWSYSTTADYGASGAGDYTGNGGNYAWIDGSNNTNGAISTLTSPLVDISPLTTPALRYYVFSENTNNNTNNQVVVEFFDGTAWNTIQTFQGNLGRFWFEVIVNLGNFTITGPVQVRFSVTGSNDPSPWYNDILIDNVEFYDGPSCYTPTNLAANNITLTSADLSWTPGDISNTQWELELIEVGQSFNGSGVFTGNPYNATNLLPGTSYLYVVREICSPGDTSNWSVPFLFTTPCPSSLLGDSMHTAIVVNSTIFSDSGNTANCYTNTTGFNAPDVWYQIILEECTGSLTIDLCNSEFDTYLRLLGSDSIEIRADDDRCGINGGPSFLNVAVNGGDTLFIVVEGFAVATGKFNLYIEQQVADLVGDRMDNPIIIPSLSYTDTSTTDSCYTNQFNGNPSKDVWYCYVADTSDYINISLCGSSFDTYLHVLDSVGNVVAFDDNNCGNQSSINSLFINQGDTIYIVVEGAGSDSGAYILDISIDTNGLTVSDVRGQMYYLDGVDDYIEIADVDLLSPSDITIEAWVYSDNWSGQTNPIIVAKGLNSEYMLWKSDDVGFDEKFAFRIGNSNTAYGTTTVQDRRWYHVAGVYSGNRLSIYVNGVLETRVPVTTAITNRNEPLTIGGLAGGVQTLSGAIDEVRIWNDERSRTEIRENMHLTLKDTETNLISYFQFNDDLAIGTPDGIRNGTRKNHGTTQNMLASTSIPSQVHVGGGTSNTQTVVAAGNVVFTGTGLSINFGATPNGEVVVSHITVEDTYNPPPYPALETGYWVVNNFGSTTTGLNATVRFDYTDGSVPTSTVSDYSLYKRPSRDFGAWPTVYPIANAASNTIGNNYCDFIGVNNFSQLVPVRVPPILLQNEFLYFNAQATAQSTALLSWSIDNENNNDFFEIQRSINGVDWEAIGVVTSLNSSQHEYTFEDKEPKLGQNYYRIKIITLDAATAFSPIKVVEFKDSYNVWVYPNPNRGEFFIEVETVSTDGIIRIYDAIGQLITVKALESSKTSIDISDYPAGMYTVQLKLGNKAYYRKIIRE